MEEDARNDQDVMQLQVLLRLHQSTAVPVVSGAGPGTHSNSNAQPQVRADGQHVQEGPEVPIATLDELGRAGLDASHSVLLRERDAAMGELELVLVDVARRAVHGEPLSFRLTPPESNAAFNPVSRQYEPVPEASRRTRVVRFNARDANSREASRFVRILSTIQALLESERRGGMVTKRELYYQGPDAYGRRQRVCDTALAEVGALLWRPRAHIGVDANPRGKFEGAVRLRVSADGHATSDEDAPHPADPQGAPAAAASGRRATVVTDWGVTHGVPRDVGRTGVLAVAPETRLVLVVEKDTAFRHLQAEQFPQREKCLLVTACGMPDLSTRQFLRQLALRRPDLPMYALVDADVEGAKIFNTYRVGSAASCLEDVALPHLEWAGVSLADLEHLGVLSPGGPVMPLSQRDLASIQRLCRRPEAAVTPALMADLEAMARTGLKAETEALERLGHARPYSWYLRHRLRLDESGLC